MRNIRRNPELGISEEKRGNKRRMSLIRPEDIVPNV